MSNAYGDVLVIDGDTEYHVDYKKYLKKLPQIRNIVFAHDAVQGMFKFNNQSFMAIVLSRDVEKRKFDEVIGALRDLKTFDFNQLIFVSNRPPKEELEYIAKLGVKNVILKPFVEDKFIEKLKTVIK